MKRRNPYFGCRKIAEQISNAFGIELNKDVVRRILVRYYRAAEPDGGGRSWLAVSDMPETACGVSISSALNQFCSRAIGSWW